MQLELDNPPLFRLTFHKLPFRRDGRLDRHRFNSANELSNNGFIDAKSSELRIPTKPAMHSNSKPAGYSDLKPATRGVVRMGQFHDVVEVWEGQETG
ncbi:hypothetical protein ACVWW4_000025 [Bradyrhizobium sp. LB7.1]